MMTPLRPMSVTSSSYWASQSSLGVSRARWRDALALLLLINAAIWSVSLLIWVKVLAGMVSLVLCIVELRAQARPHHLDYDPSRIRLTMDDGSQWQAELPTAHGCLHDRLALKGRVRGRSRWLVIYRDQMLPQHWRRLQVLVRAVST